jgi:hypothetical protein
MERISYTLSTYLIYILCLSQARPFLDVLCSPGRAAGNLVCGVRTHTAPEKLRQKNGGQRNLWRVHLRTPHCAIAWVRRCGSGRRWSGKGEDTVQKMRARARVRFREMRRFTTRPKGPASALSARWAGACGARLHFESQRRSGASSPGECLGTRGALYPSGHGGRQNRGCKMRTPQQTTHIFRESGRPAVCNEFDAVGPGPTGRPHKGQVFRPGGTIQPTECH